MGGSSKGKIRERLGELGEDTEPSLTAGSALQEDDGEKPRLTSHGAHPRDSDSRTGQGDDVRACRAVGWPCRQFVCGVGIEPRVLCALGKHSTPLLQFLHKPPVKS